MSVSPASHCSTCGDALVPGSVFCDGCGATQSSMNVARKLRQSSFDSIKDAKDGLLAAGERIRTWRHTYIIEEAIARSGFGATFRALRTRDKKQILIKQMLEQSSYDQFKKQLLQSFKREAKFLRRMRHPAFPRGYEYFQKNKSFYLVMDFINGKELAKAIEDYRDKNGKIPNGLLVHLGIEIADALHELHRAGFIYRDLKPQNVMLDGIGGRIKLIDFGTLYSPRDKNPLIFESAGYTPPEFLNSDSEFKPSGDIYSLGALLYEAATGDTPNSPGDTSALKDSDWDPRLCKIIRRCLALDPKERYSTARALQRDLKKLVSKGIWPFRAKNPIEVVELSVLPKTLFPSGCPFCEYCGYADAQSQVGYCPKCRVPLQVGVLQWKQGKKEKEFFLYADETTIGKAGSSHVCLKDLEGADKLSGTHARIFRRQNALWVEAVEQTKDTTRINQRRVLGPVELIDGDTLKLGQIQLKFSLRDAC